MPRIVTLLPLSKLAARSTASSRLSDGGDVATPVPRGKVNLTRKPNTRTTPARSVGIMTGSSLNLERLPFGSLKSYLNAWGSAWLRSPHVKDTPPHDTAFAEGPPRRRRDRAPYRLQSGRRDLDAVLDRGWSRRHGAV